MSFEIIAEGRNNRTASWNGERFGVAKVYENQAEAERSFCKAIKARNGGLIRSITLYDVVRGSRGEILSRQPITSKKF